MFIFYDGEILALFDHQFQRDINEQLLFNKQKNKNIFLAQLEYRNKCGSNSDGDWENVWHDSPLDFGRNRQGDILRNQV